MTWKIEIDNKLCHFYGDQKNPNCWYNNGKTTWADKPKLCTEATCPLKVIGGKHGDKG